MILFTNKNKGRSSTDLKLGYAASAVLVIKDFKHAMKFFSEVKWAKSFLLLFILEK